MGRTISRRSLLFGLGSLALTQLVSACQFWQRPPQFLAEFLASSIPATLLKQFQAQLKNRARLKPIPINQLSEGFITSVDHVNSPNFLQSPFKKVREHLRLGGESRSSLKRPDVVSLGDVWLTDAIQGQKIKPLDLSERLGWNELTPEFQKIVTRDAQGLLDPKGKIWGAPYRFGHLMIAYRVDKISSMPDLPKDWDALWWQELKGHISVLDNARIVLGIALKKQGASINTVVLDKVAELQETLNTLNQQIKFYSSDHYLQPLLLDDTWVAVGWSTDILPLVRRDRRINAILPESGTILTADIWVQPTEPKNSQDLGKQSTRASAGSRWAHTASRPTSWVKKEDDLNKYAANYSITSGGSKASKASRSVMLSAAHPEPLIIKWIDFYWARDIAIQLSLLSAGASPTLLSASHQDTIPSVLKQDNLLVPTEDIMNKSEFLEPLPEDAIALYHQYWVNMRRS